MNSALIAFLVHYILNKRHGGLRKELNACPVVYPVAKRIGAKRIAGLIFTPLDIDCEKI